MDATLQDPLVGRLLDGRYLVESRVARGGMATVYRAIDRRLDREVAVKVMHPHLADDDTFVSRFIHEARSAARLSHPNVVQVFDQGADGDLLYLAMEYLPGRTLRDVLNSRGVLTPREAMTVIEPVLDALSAAHRAGLVHRDVKPENVILTDEGRVKVADFGLARAATGGPTQTGALIGTVAYLSPELVTHGIADGRSDVYAAGIMLFEMLTGRQPFTGTVPMQVAYRHVHEDVPPPSSFAPELPTELDDVVRLAVARDPQERPSDAGAWLRVVRRVHGELSEAVLDHRPPRPVPAPGDVAAHGAAGATTGATQVVAGPPVHHPTQSLPPVTGLHRLRERYQREAHEDGRGHRRNAELGDHLFEGRAPRRAGPTSPADVELEELTQRRRRRGAVALAVLVVLALLLSFGGWWISVGPGAYTTTPTVTGQIETDALALLAKEGLSGEVDKGQYDEKVAEGRVLGTDPLPGAQIRKGGTVRYWLSLGSRKRNVPLVVGLPFDKAGDTLKGKGLQVKRADDVYDDKVPAGSVVSTDPAPAREVTVGDTVTVTVSKGPEPITVPDVTGQSQQDAENTLTGKGFKVDDGAQEFNNDVPPGAVIRQEPIGNSPLHRGDTVKLVISKGPDLVPVPDVFGKQYGEARQILTDQGFKVNKQDFLGGVFGTVRAQDPAAGKLAPRGSTVTVRIV